MSYSLLLHPAAKKELDKLDGQVRLFIVKSLSDFIAAYDANYETELLRRAKVKKLKGQWRGFYRLRLRNYRLIYEKIDDKLIIHIVRVAHRKQVH